MPPYAHSLDDRPEAEWEPLAEHLEAVGALAAEKGAACGLGEWARLAGLLHDLGKTSEAFQARLRGDSSRVDHSTAGAREAVRRWGLAGRVLAYAVAGHHAGLPDSADLHERCARADLPLYDVDFLTLPDTPPDFPFAPADKDLGLSLFIRMIFSCLVDADYLATERLYEPEKGARRGRAVTLDALRERLEAYLTELASSRKESRLNPDRRAIQDACRRAGGRRPGLFSLTVPTGGGKTLASLLFALHHARAHGLRRVIYAIPYTSIIEQTAAEFRKVLGDDAVLEHHSNHPYPDKEDDEGRRAHDKMKLDAQNWDAPVVVTTNVQFFESLFADRPSRCRKLQAIAGSVVVLDEAQMLPVDYLRPCMAVLRELTANYRVSAVLCTATQPALTYSKDWMPHGFEGVTEIAPDPDALHERFRRVDVREIGKLDDDALADELAARMQVLCIVDTRRQAAALFQALRDRAPDDGTFHLSARMCPVHRRERLAQIRQRLDDGVPCRVVSTQLVEAGVDVDFPEVFRALAGLDSLAQAAGRCNREAREARGTLHVFTSGRESNLPDWQRRIACARAILDRGDDPMSPAAQRTFFQRLYALERERLDAKRILNLLGEHPRKVSVRFREAAEKFKFIENPMEPAIVPYDETARERIDALKWSETPGALARGLDPYVVQLHPREINALAAAGALEVLHADAKGNAGYRVLANRDLYKDDLGLCPEDPTYLSIDSMMN
ncbi:CRISPR-associated helicase Cas3' [Ferruginivarius sediminum]|uniref:CRISPR-associated helicase Cas3 n=1 Tax=Ferruginivarius sediminum TaxID=2661937 RepID=A0A369TAP3_9PROT|nr:CRISPR-associated helicase Cas3' [Ferruginivarius sediminum]RDD61247.1 CRISPR-associated helicase Cas3' [Ferruginivarius sediminum]